MVDTTITLEPGLYVTATPIGNLGDITYRAVAALKNADLILCEDTRQTAKLCSAYGIETPRSPYHDHNAERVRPDIIKKLQDGAAICLVSDAGTPLISDPGYKLVRETRDAGVPVIPLPGACALVSALSAAGAPSDHFYFAGFAPSKPGAREKFLTPLANINATLIFYESSSRLAASLKAMAAAFGERRAAVARELTKIHEEIREGALGDLAAYYDDKPAKGELVVLVYPQDKSPVTQEELDAFLAAALKEMSVKDAAATAASNLDISKKIAYARFAIIERRFRAHGGEIDIIAKRGKLIAFVEVKARRSLAAAVDAVSHRNRQRVISAAEAFTARHPHLAQCHMRYDIIAVAGWRIQHLPNAWRYDD
ncbi:Ribosomal RNA small subunit methyltransferase I (16S rRNA 2'-O-ribose C1402 methyltransferase) (rRNA (cytidine-2'-O-)-methyltransferase RsmI) [Durusdinium trenchii]|uniref:Ribosomal RNA small subunit methyltransferase I (16S rRNA 2'-O-ribose C1402 methyltransferase) (rRNA (cytidine-2'-O-)-methyltransferase RsmI) n=1 Tax=Durusdinium trenchii TaxID=1381693 RepID=A0ABP0LRW1_9DINO